MKNAYIIITDTHNSPKKKPNRYSYQYETSLVKLDIDNIGRDYIKRGYNPIAVYLGDIYDNSYNDPALAMIEQDDMVNRKKIFKKIFSVMGNHELNFPKNNPFWILTSKDSIKVNNKPKVNFKALGTTGIIEVVDRIIDGNVVFNFNHYSSDILKPLEGKLNIGLFHQNIVCSPAINSAVNKGLNPYQTSAIMLDTNDVLVGYKYSFFGHYHKYYGFWQIDDVDDPRFIYYLASLGRPNQEEVSDNFLERNVPAVLVDNGEFVGVEDNFITLLDRSSSVNELKVKQQQEKRKKVKEKKELINMDICIGSVIDSVKTSFDEPIYGVVIDKMLSNELDDYYAIIKQGGYSNV